MSSALSPVDPAAGNEHDSIVDRGANDIAIAVVGATVDVPLMPTDPHNDADTGMGLSSPATADAASTTAPTPAATIETRMELTQPKLTQAEPHSTTTITLQWNTQLHATSYILECMTGRAHSAPRPLDSAASVVYSGPNSLHRLTDLHPNRTFSVRARAIGGRFEASRVNQTTRIHKKTSTYSMSEATPSAASSARAIVIAVDSAWTPWFDFTTSQLSTPDLKCASRTKNSLKLQWSPVNGCEGVAIAYVPESLVAQPIPADLRDAYVHDGPDGDLHGLTDVIVLHRGPPNVSAYTHKSLRPGAVYHFAVCCIGAASDGSDDSPWSEVHQFATAAAVPNVPGELKRIASTKDSITLEWAETPCNGAPIIDYTLQRMNVSASSSSSSSSSKDSWCIEYSGRACRHTVCHLVGGELYQFRVKASNQVGSSVYSAPSRFGTDAAPPDAPLPPNIDKKANKKPRTLKLCWEAPINTNGAKIEGYIVRLSTCAEPSQFDTMAELVREYNSKQCSLEISGLLPGAAYHAQVCANSTLGLSSPSVPIVTFHTMAEAPSQPGTPAVKGHRHAHKGDAPDANLPKVNPNKFTLVWSPASPNGAPVSAYTLDVSTPCRSKEELTHLRSSLTGDDARAAWTLLGTATTPTFTCANTAGTAQHRAATSRALKHASFYLIRVTATNAQGSSAPSQLLAVQTEIGPPAAPSVGVKLAKVTLSTLHLHWSLANLNSLLNGSTLAGFGFELQEIGSNGANKRRHAFVAQIADLHIDGDTYTCALPADALTPNTPHTIRFQLLTSTGVSSPYGPPTPFTSSPPLPAPPIFEAVSDDLRKPDAITVAWRADSTGAHDKSKPGQLQYVLAACMRSELPVGAKSSLSSAWQDVYRGSGLSCAVVNLAASSLYAFRVSAIAAHGSSQWSDILEVRTRKHKPLPLTNMQKVTGDYASVRVRMCPATRIGDDEPPATFMIHYAIAGSSDWLVGFSGPLDLVVSGVDHPYVQKTIRGLSPSTRYTIRARGGNEEGFGAWTNTITVETEPLPPPPPTKPIIMIKKEGWDALKARTTQTTTSENEPTAAIPVIISWSYGVYDADSIESSQYVHDSSLPISYVLSQRLGGGAFFPIYVGPTPSFAHSLDPTQLYSFMVTVESASGVSKPSAKCRWEVDEWIEANDPTAAQAKKAAVAAQAAKEEKERIKRAAAIKAEREADHAARKAQADAAAAAGDAGDADDSVQSKKRSRGRKKKSNKNTLQPDGAEDGDSDSALDGVDDDIAVGSVSTPPASLSLPSGPILTPIEIARKKKEAKRRYQLFQMIILLVAAIAVAIGAIIYIKANKNTAHAYESATTRYGRK